MFKQKNEKDQYWNKEYKNYKESGEIHELAPDIPLMKYSSYMEKGNLLDIGCGNGRNSFYFARNGFSVDGIDLSGDAIDKYNSFNKNNDLELNLTTGDLKNLEIKEENYSLVIAAWILMFFNKKDREELIHKLIRNLKKGGILYIAVFSLEDPGYEINKNKLEMVEENTFYLKKRDLFFHYFTKEEIMSYFKDFKIIYSAEGLSLDQPHGNCDDEHYHGFINLVLRKK